MMSSPYESVNQYPWIPDDATSEQYRLVKEVVAKLKDEPNIKYLEEESGWVVNKKLIIKYMQVGSKVTPLCSSEPYIYMHISKHQCV